MSENKIAALPKSMLAALVALAAAAVIAFAVMVPAANAEENGNIVRIENVDVTYVGAPIDFRVGQDIPVLQNSDFEVNTPGVVLVTPHFRYWNNGIGYEAEGQFQPGVNYFILLSFKTVEDVPGQAFYRFDATGAKTLTVQNLGIPVVKMVYTTNYNDRVFVAGPELGVPYQLTLTLAADPENGGAVYGGGAFNEGDQFAIKAVPADGYTFVNWTNSAGEVVSTSANYIGDMPGEDMTLTAHFQVAPAPSPTPDNGNNIPRTGDGMGLAAAGAALIAMIAAGFAFSRRREM